MGDFTKLAVWKAHELTLQIYRETSKWPRHELFGLTSSQDGRLSRFLRTSRKAVARTATPNWQGTRAIHSARRASSFFT